MSDRKLTYANYEQELQKIARASELMEFLKLMTEEAEEVFVIPSPKVKDAHELAFNGLPGINETFIIFRDPQVAKGFGQPAGGVNNLLYFVHGSETYCFPHTLATDNEIKQ